MDHLENTQAMKPLDQYETPETDAAWKDGYTFDEEDLTKARVHSRDIERRLAACREALQRLIKNAPCPNAGTLYQVAYGEARETLTLTKP